MKLRLARLSTKLKLNLKLSLAIKMDIVATTSLPVDLLTVTDCNAAARANFGHVTKHSQQMYTAFLLTPINPYPKWTPRGPKWPKMSMKVFGRSDQIS